MDAKSNNSSPQTLSLEKRFHHFVVNELQGESIDNLTHLIADSAGKPYSHADYLLEDRQFILEVKTLYEDRSEAVNAWLNKLTETDAWLDRNWRGQESLESIINRHPQAVTFRQKIMDYAYRRIRNDIMKEGVKQVVSTKRILGLDRAISGLVILNENVECFDASNVSTEVEFNFFRKNRKGVRECEGLDFVYIISETSSEKNSGYVPCHLVIHEQSKNPAYIENYFKFSFLLRWSEFNGRPVMSVGS